MYSKYIFSAAAAPIIDYLDKSSIDYTIILPYNYAIQGDTMEAVSIFIINYNGENVLEETIESLRNQDYPLKTITLIDDCSKDKSISLAQKRFPQIEIIGLSYNTGFPNKLRKMAVGSCKTRYVFLTDNDIVFEKNCLSRLMDVIRSTPKIGICTPRLMYYNDKKKNYVCWTKFHYLCASISPLRDTYSPSETTATDTLGGGIMLLDRQKINEVGNIDDSYPMGWGEDAEIYARMKIAGYKTIYVPQAAGFHHAKEFARQRVSRPFGQARNRWLMMLSMYQLKTMILISPILFFYECVTVLMLIPKKLAKPYIMGILNVLKNIKDILHKRIQIQKTRKVNDKDFLSGGAVHVPQAYLSNPVYKTGINYLNKILSGYWRLISNFL